MQPTFKTIMTTNRTESELVSQQPTIDSVLRSIKDAVRAKPTALNAYGLQLWDGIRGEIEQLVAASAAPVVAPGGAIEVIAELRKEAETFRKSDKKRAAQLDRWIRALEVGPDRSFARMADPVRDYITGMSVSVDVSTGEDDAHHRYFGTVTEVMDDNGDKHGVTLLVQDAKPNFKVAAKKRVTS